MMYITYIYCSRGLFYNHPLLYLILTCYLLWFWSHDIWFINFIDWGRFFCIYYFLGINSSSDILRKLKFLFNKVHYLFRDIYIQVLVFHLAIFIYFTTRLLIISFKIIRYLLWLLYVLSRLFFLYISHYLFYRSIDHH